MTTTTTRPLTVTEAEDLAAELVRELGTMPGDRAAVSATLARWADELDAVPLSQVCMAAVRLTFGDCLTLTRHEDWPELGTALELPCEG